MKEALVAPEPLKLMLWVVKRPHGPDSHHALEPQSMAPLGYWPLKTRFGLLRSSNVTVREFGAGVLVGLGPEPELNARLSKLVLQPLLLPIVTLEHAELQPVEIVVI